MERRNCVKVIDEILSIIPKDEVKLILALEWNKDDAFYKAPEENIPWERTYDTLMTNIYPPKEEWQFKVWSIFTTKSVEELKKALEE